MANLFEDAFSTQITDPNEAAQRNMRALKRRFYTTVEAVKRDGGFAIALDGRAVRTPARGALSFPSRPLAERAIAEWQAQAQYIDAAQMPLTRLANTIIDGVATATAEIAADVMKYLRSDLVIYRADGPERLVTRQRAQWDPVLAWARDTHGARFVITEGVVFVDQPEHAVAAMSRWIPTTPWRLGATHVITTLTGSALLALALAEDAITPDAAWTAAHVDEDWNAEFWGQDALAQARRAQRRAEFDAATAVLQFCGEPRP